MVKRLLNALEYPGGDAINVNDENIFRKLIVWLEEKKIVGASRNTYENLNKISSGNWTNVYNRYKEEIGCPVLATRLEEVQWLLGYAVQMETDKNKHIYIKHAVENMKTSNVVPNIVAENPLDKLDFRGPEFVDGIKSLAMLLKVPPNPDPLITLRAVRKVITKRLCPQAVENPHDFLIQGPPFPLQDADLGFDLNDKILNQAAKILRLLYIHDLRDLQTKANELIVAVQNVTANPKTDTKLGKVGR